MTVPDVDPAVHIQVLEQVVQGRQLTPIADQLKVDLRIVRALAAQAGAPDLGEVRSNLQRLTASTKSTQTDPARTPDDHDGS